MVSACTTGHWRQGQVWKSKASILTYLSRGNGEEVSGSTRQPSEHVIELPAVALLEHEEKSENSSPRIFAPPFSRATFQLIRSHSLLDRINR